MSMIFSFQGPQFGLRLTWAGASTPWSRYNAIFLVVTCWPLPCVPCIQSVNYRCTDALFTGRLANSELGHSGIPSLSAPLPPFPRGPHPLNQLRGLGERCKLPQWGLGQSPSRQTIWCISEPQFFFEIALLCFCDASAIRLIGNCK